MDNERIIRIFNRLKGNISEEKILTLNSYLLNAAIKKDDKLYCLDIASICISEITNVGIVRAIENIKKVMKCMELESINDMLKFIGEFASDGYDFLIKLREEIKGNDDLISIIDDYIKNILEQNKLIEAGFPEFNASIIANAPKRILSVDDEDIPLIGNQDDTFEGYSNDTELVIYKEITNKVSNDTYYISFFVIDNYYLRFIGKKNQELTHVVNERGTFNEIEVKRFISSEANNFDAFFNLIKDKKGFKETSGANNYELIQSIYKEIEELSEFNGLELKVEEILNKSKHIYELKQSK